MKVLRLICIAVPLLLGIQFLTAQSLKSQMDQVYGLSPILFNGKIYSDFYNHQVKGHQFLEKKQMQYGDITVQNQVFADQRLNLDIYKQKVLLEFQDLNKAVKLIEIPLEHISEFNLNNKRFIVVRIDSNNYKTHQLIDGEQYQFYIHWYKKLETTSTTSVYDYLFTDAKREILLIQKGNISPISKNKSLIKSIEPQFQKTFKKWLKNNKIKVHKATDTDFYEIIQYLEQL